VTEETAMEVALRMDLRQLEELDQIGVLELPVGARVQLSQRR
jgi:hypothetical protein